MPKLLRDILLEAKKKDIEPTDNLVCRNRGYHDWRTQSDTRMPDKCASCHKERK